MLTDKQCSFDNNGVNYSELTLKAIEVILKNPTQNDSDECLGKLLKNLTPGIIHIISKSLEIVSKEGLSCSRAIEAFKNSTDLIGRASIDQEIIDSLDIPEIYQHTISTSFIIAMRSLTLENQCELKACLKLIHPELKDALLSFFKNVGENLLPIIQTILVKITRIGMDDEHAGNKSDSLIGDILEMKFYSNVEIIREEQIDSDSDETEVLGDLFLNIGNFQ